MQHGRDVLRSPVSDDVAAGLRAQGQCSNTALGTE